jgi:Na+:H+ antiporter, NhaC family
MLRANNTPSLAVALTPLILLVALLFLALRLYGDEAVQGPSQIALLLATGLTLLIGCWLGHNWQVLEREIFNAMSVVLKPIFILLAVGVMIAAWIAGGVVPSLIYYGLKILTPGIFYAAACVLCALVSLAIGSSWTTAASIGVALIGTAKGLGLSAEITAGAIVSGAYFGDKMSPLSDTTNLAPAVAEVELFSHIRHMAWTGIPSLVIAISAFLVLGMMENTQQVISMHFDIRIEQLEQNFRIAWFMLLPLVVLLWLAWRRMPALAAISLAALLGMLQALLLQSVPVTSALVERSAAWQTLGYFWSLAVSGYPADTGSEVLDSLLTGGGAGGMLNTIWLILCAVFFGSAMEKTGLLAVLIDAVLSMVRGTASLVVATVFTGIGANLITGDQYIAIVLPGRMYKLAYQARGLAAVNLSRAVEDSATVTSPLVPWNTCGAFMAAALGVGTLAYLPYCFFNLVMPVLSIIYGIFNVRMIVQGTQAA